MEDREQQSQKERSPVSAPVTVEPNLREEILLNETMLASLETRMNDLNQSIEETQKSVVLHDCTIQGLEDDYKELQNRREENRIAVQTVTKVLDRCIASYTSKIRKTKMKFKEKEIENDDGKGAELKMKYGTRGDSSIEVDVDANLHVDVDIDIDVGFDLNRNADRKANRNVNRNVNESKKMSQEYLANSCNSRNMGDAGVHVDAHEKETGARNENGPLEFWKNLSVPIRGMQSGNKKATAKSKIISYAEQRWMPHRHRRRCEHSDMNTISRSIFAQQREVEVEIAVAVNGSEDEYGKDDRERTRIINADTIMNTKNHILPLHAPFESPEVLKEVISISQKEVLARRRKCASARTRKRRRNNMTDNKRGGEHRNSGDGDNYCDKNDNEHYDRNGDDDNDNDENNSTGGGYEYNPKHAIYGTVLDHAICSQYDPHLIHRVYPSRLNGPHRNERASVTGNDPNDDSRSNAGAGTGADVNTNANANTSTDGDIILKQDTNTESETCTNPCSTTSSMQIDANTILCRKALFGKCDDPSCVYQHLSGRANVSIHGRNRSQGRKGGGQGTYAVRNKLRTVKMETDNMRRRNVEVILPIKRHPLPPAPISFSTLNAMNSNLEEDYDAYMDDKDLIAPGIGGLKRRANDTFCEDGDDICNVGNPRVRHDGNGNKVPSNKWHRIDNFAGQEHDADGEETVMGDILERSDVEERSQLGPAGNANSVASPNDDDEALNGQKQNDATIERPLTINNRRKVVHLNVGTDTDVSADRSVPAFDLEEDYICLPTIDDQEDDEAQFSNAVDMVLSESEGSATDSEEECDDDDRSKASSVYGSLLSGEEPMRKQHYDEPSQFLRPLSDTLASVGFHLISIHSNSDSSFCELRYNPQSKADTLDINARNVDPGSIIFQWTSETKLLHSTVKALSLCVHSGRIDLSKAILDYAEKAMDSFENSEKGGARLIHINNLKRSIGLLKSLVEGSTGEWCSLSPSCAFHIQLCLTFLAHFVANYNNAIYMCASLDVVTERDLSDIADQFKQHFEIYRGLVYQDHTQRSDIGVDTKLRLASFSTILNEIESLAPSTLYVTPADSIINLARFFHLGQQLAHQSAIKADHLQDSQLVIESIMFNLHSAMKLYLSKSTLATVDECPRNTEKSTTIYLHPPLTTQLEAFLLFGPTVFTSLSSIQKLMNAENENASERYTDSFSSRQQGVMIQSKQLLMQSIQLLDFSGTIANNVEGQLLLCPFFSSLANVLVACEAFKKTHVLIVNALYAAHTKMNWAVYSDLLWSQLIQIHMTFPFAGEKGGYSKLHVDGSLESLQNDISSRPHSFGVWPSKVILEGDSSLAHYANFTFLEGYEDLDKSSTPDTVQSLCTHISTYQCTKNSATSCAIDLRSGHSPLPPLIENFPMSLCLIGRHFLYLTMKGLNLESLPLTFGSVFRNLKVYFTTCLNYSTSLRN